MKKKFLTNSEGEVRELTRGDIKDMGSPEKVLPPELFRMLPKKGIGKRGVQKQPKKIQKTLRYSPEVLNYFQAEGPGWQRRINEVLIEWIKEHPH